MRDYRPEIVIDYGAVNCTSAPILVRVKETDAGKPGPWTKVTCPGCSLHYYIPTD